MAETLTRVPSSNPEVSRPNVETKIWNGVDETVDGVLREAGQYIDTHEGVDRTAVNLSRVAFALQSRHIDEADEAEMTTSELTTQQLTLLILESPFVAQAIKMLNQNKEGSVDLGLKERNQYAAIASRFNHHFAECLSCMSPAMMNGFSNKVLDRTRGIYANKLNLPCTRNFFPFNQNPPKIQAIDHNQHQKEDQKQGH
jgi:hypothetical protein